MSGTLQDLNLSAVPRLEWRFHFGGNVAPELIRPRSSSQNIANRGLDFKTALPDAFGHKYHGPQIPQITMPR